MRNILRKTLALPLVAAAVLTVSCKNTPDTPPGTDAPAVAGNGAGNIVFVPGFNDIIGVEWKLVEVRSSAESAAARFSRKELAEAGMENAYTLRFDEKQLSGTGAPNRYFAPYEEGAGKTLSVKAIAGTLMAVLKEPESLKEREYFKYLENVSGWDLVQNRLQLRTRDEQGAETVLIFEAVS
jgi:heat shock protein HslJ